MKCFFKSFYIVSLCVCLFSSISLAQDYVENGQEKPELTQTHTIGFLFHKLAGTKPDYMKWVDIYLKSDLDQYGEEGRKLQIRRAKNRFVNFYKNISVEKDSKIVLPLYASMEVVPFESRYLMNIKLRGSNFIIKDTPEFAINIVVPDLEDKLELILSRKEYKDFQERAGTHYNRKQNVNLFFTVNAVDADGSRPLVVDNKEYWMMLTEFVTFEIWDGQMNKKIWQYVSEEEKQQNLNELRNLYKTQEDNNEEKMNNDVDIDEIYEDFPY